MADKDKKPKPTKEERRKEKDRINKKFGLLHNVRRRKILEKLEKGKDKN